jgi:F-type H+-transporting ATPase subunit c
MEEIIMSILEFIQPLMLMVHYAAADGLGAVLMGSAIGAGIAVFTGIGACIANGITSGKAVEAIARQPEAAGSIRGTMILGMAITETAALYGFAISFLLIFANPFVDMFVNALGL